MNLTVDAWIMAEARRASETYDMTLSRIVSEGIALRIAQLDAATHANQITAAGFDDDAHAKAQEQALAEDSATTADQQRGAA